MYHTGSKSRFCSWLLHSIWIGLALCWFQGLPLASAQTMPELIQLLEDREALLTQYSVRVEMVRKRKRQPSETQVPRTAGVANNGNLPDILTFLTQKWIQVDGNKWFEDAREDADVSGAPQRRRSAFDGKVLSKLYGTMDQWYAAIIEESEIEFADGSISEVVAGGFKPWSFALKTFGETVEVENGLIRVKFREKEEQFDVHNMMMRAVMWFDPEHGYAPVRQENQFKIDGKWSLASEWHIDGFYSLPDRVCLPKVATWNHSTFQWDGSGSAEIDMTTVYTFSDWVLGDIDREQTYRVPFPPQVLVRDERVGKEFRAIELTDWEIENEVANVPKFTSGPRYTIFLILALAVVIGIWLFWRRQSSVR